MTFLIRSRFFNTALSAAALIVPAVLIRPAHAAPGASAGDATKGQAVFTKNSCVTCHAGGDNTMDPNHPIKGAAFQQKYKDDAVLENTIRNGFPQYGMPSFTKAMINDRDMKDLIAYVRTFSATGKKSK
jgi:mono/diheme cytochrome c family protein